MLIHHVVEYWIYAFFSKFWVSETDDGLETTIENGFLLFNIAELLIFNDDLGLTWSADSHCVCVEVSR